MDSTSSGTSSQVSGQMRPLKAIDFSIDDLVEFLCPSLGSLETGVVTDINLVQDKVSVRYQSLPLIKVNLSPTEITQILSSKAPTVAATAPTPTQVPASASGYGTSVPGSYQTLSRELEDLSSQVAKTEAACECGLQALGMDTGHSSWCPRASS